ncbi:MAG TPA: hypothetical protein GXX63_06205 [Tissierellia bacterium]|nr:hypothetical protein [Tissierellia bacterium]
MFKNEVTLLKKENLRQMENVKEDDKDTIYEIMKSMSVFKVNSYDAQVIQRDLIGMAQDSELRGADLKNVIGNDIKSFSNEIIKNSYGPSIIEILLSFFTLLSGYLFGMHILPAYLQYQSLSWQSTPVIYLLYVGVVLINFIADGIITPLFINERGFKKHIPTLISISSFIILVIITFLIKDRQNIITIKAQYIIIASGLGYLVLKYLSSLNIHRLAENKTKYIEDLYEDN